MPHAISHTHAYHLFSLSRRNDGSSPALLSKCLRLFSSGAIEIRGECGHAFSSLSKIIKSSSVIESIISLHLFPDQTLCTHNIEFEKSLSFEVSRVVPFDICGIN